MTTVFYSWQSDLKSSTNRGFIKTALENAVSAIKADESIQVEPRVDHDTLDVPGSPDIAATILAKIDAAAVFVCDISIINADDKSRKTPNPNVLFELGYAVKSLGIGKIIMVFNTAYGEMKQLPFDLQKNRVLTYSVLPEDDKTPAKKELQGKLETALRYIFGQEVSQKVAEEEIDQEAAQREEIRTLLADPNQVIPLSDKLSQEAAAAYKELEASFLFDYSTSTSVSVDELTNRLRLSEQAVHTLVNLFSEGCRWAQGKQVEPFGRVLKRMATTPDTGRYFFPEWQSLSHYPALLMLYAGGIPALASDNYQILRHLMKELHHRESTSEKSTPLIWELNPVAVFYKNLGRLLPGKEKGYTPASDYLYEQLQPVFLRYIPNEEELQSTFDRFEYLLSLICGELVLAQKEDRFWVPWGSYLWRRRLSFNVMDEVREEIERQGDNWPPIREGLFDSSVEEMLELKAKVDRFIQGVRYHRDIF